jgi:hypothetical protein
MRPSSTPGPCRPDKHGLPTSIRLTWLLNVIEPDCPSFDFLAAIPQASPYQTAAQLDSVSPEPDGLLVDGVEGNRFARWRVESPRVGSVFELSCELYFRLGHEDLLSGLSIDDVVGQDCDSRYTERCDDEADEALVEEMAASSDSLAAFLEELWKHCLARYEGRADVVCGHYAYRIMQLLRVVGVPCRYGFGTMRSRARSKRCATATPRWRRRVACCSMVGMRSPACYGVCCMGTPRPRPGPPTP